MKLIGLLSSALLVAALSAACTRASNNRISVSTSSTNGSTVEVKSKSSFSETSDVREVFADVPEGAVSNTLKVDTRAIEQGTIVLRVFAPDGTKKLEQTFGMAERREHEFTLETTVGKWRAEAELQGAQGTYAINWVAAR
jgi:hypothetical protein